MKNIFFRKYMDQIDFHDVYRIMTDSKEQKWFQTKRVFNTDLDFHQWFMNQMKYYYHDFYMIIDQQSKKTLGFVYSCDFRIGDGHCMICLYILPEYRNAGIGAIAGLHFLKELFQEYPLRKVFTTIYDYNKQSLMTNLQAGFQEEGVFREYRYYDDRYWDMHILSMTRERFDRKLAPLLGDCHETL